MLDLLLQNIFSFLTIISDSWVNKSYYYDMLAMCKKRVTFCDKVTERYPNEWTLKLTVPNISSMKDPVLSVPCIIGNLPWRIKIMKKQNE